MSFLDSMSIDPNARYPCRLENRQIEAWGMMAQQLRYREEVKVESVTAAVVDMKKKKKKRKGH